MENVRESQVCSTQLQIHIFPTRMPKFLLSLKKFLNFVGFERYIILKLLFNIKSVATSENQRIKFKSLLISYFILKQNKSGAE